MKPTFFATPAKFRAWLEKHHASETELLVGFYKRDSGKPSITWPESIDQALCFGWIDGVRHSIDEHRYTIRFTPRKERSVWSQVNLKRMGELQAKGLVHEAGVAAWKRRAEDSSKYSYEAAQSAKFDEAFVQRLRANKKAVEYFDSMPPGYRRTATFWVMSAKKEETRVKRFETLLGCCERGERIGLLKRD